MTERDEINKILNAMHPQAALDLINSIGKERRRKNCMRICAGGMVNVIDAERPDLVKLKDESHER